MEYLIYVGVVVVGVVAGAYLVYRFSPSVAALELELKTELADVTEYAEHLVETVEARVKALEASVAALVAKIEGKTDVVVTKTSKKV